MCQNVYKESRKSRLYVATEDTERSRKFIVKKKFLTISAVQTG
jgi:hypothetical protein